MDDGEQDDWAQAIGEIWARDWSNPREDIYTSDDGESLPETSPHDRSRTPQT